MMTPRVGYTYKLSLEPPFNVHDGIYTILSIYTYEEAVANRLNLSSIYISSGRTQQDFVNDEVGLRADRFLKVKVVDTSATMMIPMSLLALEPDPNIKEYMRLALGVDLGIFDDYNDINYVINTLNSILSEGVGITSEPIISAISSAWMTTDEYQHVEEERQLVKQTVVNLYTENKKLLKELSKAYAKINAYEEVLKTL